jgi:hypothetical protein
MSCSITSSELAFNKTRWGDIPKLTHANYNEWEVDMILILAAVRAHTIFSRDDRELHPLDFDNDDNDDDC